MEPLNFKYQYFALFFIFLFISISSVAAVDSTFVSDNSDSSSQIDVFSIKDEVDINSSYLGNEDENSSKYLNIQENSKDGNVSNTKINQYNSKDDGFISSLGASKTTKTVISAKSLSMNYGTDSTIVGYLKNSSGKAIKSKVVKITINGQTWSKTTDSNGKISLKIPILDPNIYSLKFSFAGDNSYSASSYLVNVTVNKLSTKILSNNVYYYDNNKLVAYLKDNNNNPLKDKLLKFTIDGSTFNAFSDSNGKCEFNIPNYLKVQNYSCTLKFVGDKYYSSSSTSVKVYKFDDNTLEGFISELINSKEFNELFSNTNSKEFNQSFQNSSELSSFNQLLNNLTDDELESINQFLNLISEDDLTIDLNNLDSTKLKYFNLAISTSNSKQTTNSNQNINEVINVIENIWKWLNTPILEIPGYADLDKKYGVFGQGLKLAGWFLLGIDDKGGLTPLDIGLDALSICSGAGLAERLGISSSSLILKLSNKFPRFDSLLKSSVKIKGLDYSLTIKTLFNAYKSSLSILNNPIKFVSNEVISSVLNKWDSKIASFAMGYISNSFLTVSSVLGIGEVYVNSKDNTLFTTKILLNIDKGNAINLIINGSTSPIASTLKNIKTTIDSISNTIGDISKTVDNTISTVKNTVSSTVNKVSSTVKAVSTTVSQTVKKVTTAVKKTVKKVVSKVKKTVKKVVKAVKKTVKKVVSKVKKAVKKVAKKVKKTVKKTVKNVSNTVKKVVSKVKKTVKNVSNTVKKTVKSVSAAIKKLK